MLILHDQAYDVDNTIYANPVRPKCVPVETFWTNHSPNNLDPTGQNQEFANKSHIYPPTHDHT